MAAAIPGASPRVSSSATTYSASGVILPRSSCEISQRSDRTVGIDHATGSPLPPPLTAKDLRRPDAGRTAAEGLPLGAPGSEDIDGPARLDGFVGLDRHTHVLPSLFACDERLCILCDAPYKVLDLFLHRPALPLEGGVVDEWLLPGRTAVRAPSHGDVAGLALCRVELHRPF